MAHSDDDGLVLPPRIAPLQVVIVPIYKGADQKALIDAKVNGLVQELKKAGVRVKYDDSEHSRPGWKFAEYELKGVPVRIAIGARDLENNVGEVVRRDTREKKSISLDGLGNTVIQLLEEIQQAMFDKAKAFRDAHIIKVDNWEDFEKALEGEGGFVSAHWDGTPETEEAIKQKSKATIRCIPLNNPQEEGKCVFSGNASKERVLFARAY